MLSINLGNYESGNIDSDSCGYMSVPLCLHLHIIQIIDGNSITITVESTFVQNRLNDDELMIILVIKYVAMVAVVVES